ncbi:glucose-6-phosphate dehydrogenase [Altericroceibacterium xinjiangense]|uniref:glucose-6-phosphate dehydrogenase n=1 Tax=Altericroceibacterium xinjiangense TaxID=762261 RepID=UPI000F7E3552|nr:glucose-6-phosphate dehydrogenase [Altericroceibacterium xinjiangense]
MSFTSDRLLLFGATGDLAQRMLLPSLCALNVEELLPPNLQILGTARAPMSDGEFRNFARSAIEKYLPAHRRGQMADFLNRLSYQPIDATTIEGYDKLAEQIGERESLSIFLSTGPSLFPPTIKGLQSAGLTDGDVRIGLEKPLGVDLESSREINDAVGAAFPEERIYRIDHYLGKETVQNLLALRFANILFEPIWNARYIEHIQITVAETVGVDERMDFYDQTGALRDMVQNHMLQLLSLVAMEPPTSFDAGAVHDEKVKVLRALRPIGRGESATGQYGAGTVAGDPVSGFLKELDKDSDTETFVALKAHVDNWRWAGVPFYLRTGKRLPERVTEIVVQFRCIPHSIFTGANTVPNRLVIGIQPEENITLSLMAKVPGLDRDGISLRRVPLEIAIPDPFTGQVQRIAYERLLLDLIEGNRTLFVRRDEVEAQWEWIDAIRASWQQAGQAPEPYDAGTWGPEGAARLVARDGVSWND